MRYEAIPIATTATSKMGHTYTRYFRIQVPCLEQENRVRAFAALYNGVVSRGAVLSV